MPTIHPWTPILVSDVTDNDSDKLWTVGASELWRPLHIWIKLVSSATVGNRQICVEFQDDTAETGVVIAQMRAGAVQAASVTRYYLFAPEAPDLTSMRDTDLLTTPLPQILLFPGYRLRVYDKAAVAASADDMAVKITYEYRSI